MTGSDPSEATIGSLVRFMWNPGNNSSICWIQGQIAKRVDPYKGVSKFKWETNRVTVRNLEIINCWGEEYIRKLPKTMTVDLSRKGILVLGTEVTLNTNGGNEDSKANMDRMTKIIEHCDNDTEEMLGEKTNAEGTSKSSIMTTLEVETTDSKAGGRVMKKVIMPSSANLIIMRLLKSSATMR